MGDDDQTIVLAVPNRSSSSQMNAELAHVIQAMDYDAPAKKKTQNLLDVDSVEELEPVFEDIDNRDSLGEQEFVERMVEHGLSRGQAEDVYSHGYDVSVNFSYLQPVDANRNKMVKNFLRDESNEWLLMVDNDVVPPMDILGMVEYGEKVVSATVTIKKEGVPHPVIVKQRDDGQYRRITMQEYEEEISDEGLVEVDGVGTGCLLIHRSVLEDMEPPWFKFVYNEDGTLKLGEDFYFGEMLRQMGQSMYVSSEYVCSHYRRTDLTEFAQIVAEAENVSVDNT